GKTITTEHVMEVQWEGPNSPGRKPGQGDQATYTRGFFTQIKNHPAWQVEGITPHIVTDGMVSAVGNDYGYWQNCRGPIRLPSGQAYSGSADWKPVAFTFRDLANGP